MSLDKANEENGKFIDLNSHPSIENPHCHIYENPGKAKITGGGLGVTLGMEELRDGTQYKMKMIGDWNRD